MGGFANTASGAYSAVAGGAQNFARETYAAVAGGFNNTSSGQASAVSGGTHNFASGTNSIVAGGQNSFATGVASIVAGGASNQALGTASLAAGTFAIAEKTGEFVWADNAQVPFNPSDKFDNQNGTFWLDATNTFNVRATGGVLFVSGVNASGFPTVGVSFCTRAPGHGRH